MQILAKFNEIEFKDHSLLVRSRKVAHCENVLLSVGWYEDLISCENMKGGSL